MNGDCPKPIQLFTAGHSNRSFEDFRHLLEEFHIRAIADVRRFPSSRKFPHFNQLSLRDSLHTENIMYVWFEALGGLRHTSRDEKSPNTGLKSPAFRNYADYMMTDEFQEAIAKLLSLSTKHRTAIMCAEKFFWKCHRRLLSDFLVARGVKVDHILEPGNLRPHKLSTGAVVRDEGGVIYPESLDGL